VCGQNVELLNVKLVVHVVTTGLQRVKDLLVPTVSADNCDVSRFKYLGQPRRASRGLRTFCLWVGWMMCRCCWRCGCSYWLAVLSVRSTEPLEVGVHGGIRGPVNLDGGGGGVKNDNFI
jgi:hypothetical protein